MPTLVLHETLQAYAISYKNNIQTKALALRKIVCLLLYQSTLQYWRLKCILLISIISSLACKACFIIVSNTDYSFDVEFVDRQSLTGNNLTVPKQATIAKTNRYADTQLVFSLLIIANILYTTECLNLTKISMSMLVVRPRIV